jgi:hypothetical protein
VAEKELFKSIPDSEAMDMKKFDASVNARFPAERDGKSVKETENRPMCCVVIGIAIIWAEAGRPLDALQKYLEVHFLNVETDDIEGTLKDWQKSGDSLLRIVLCKNHFNVLWPDEYKVCSALDRILADGRRLPCRTL